MKQHDSNNDAATPTKGSAAETLTAELLILPDGHILVHNLTRPFAELLRELNPNDEQIQPRAADPETRSTVANSSSTIHATSA